MSSTIKLEDFLVDGQQVPGPKAWMPIWSQQGAEVMISFSREMATLSERIGSMEESMKTCVTEKQLEVQAAETKDHFKRLGTEIHQVENQIGAFFHEAALRKALSKLFSETLSTELENRAHDIEKLQAAVADKWKSAAAELPLQTPLEKEVLQTHKPAIPEVSNGGSQPRAKVKSRKSDAWHMPDVVGTKGESLAAEVLEMQALMKKEELQSQLSVGDALELAADLEFRESLSRENLALLSEPKALMLDHPLIASTTASKASDGSTSPDDGSNSPEAAPFPKPRASIMGNPLILTMQPRKPSDVSTRQDDRSPSPEDQSMSSAALFSTRTTSSESFGGSCKFFVERIRGM
jgi:hypothetical protein